MDELDIEAVAEGSHHLLGLAGAHQAVIDVDAGKLVADRLVDQHRGHRGIHAARKAADDPAGADLGTDAGDLSVAEAGHGPIALAAGNAADEVAQQLRAVRGVHHLRVEHQAVKAAGIVGEGGEGGTLAGADCAEAGRQADHPVAMAHPHLLAPALLPDAVEQGAIVLHVDEGAAELAVVGAFDLAA